MNERKQRIEAIFDAAIELKSREQREIYLERTCGEDGELRAEVDELVEAYLKSGSFLSTSIHPRKTTSSDAETSLGESPLIEGPGAVIGRYKLLQQIGEGGCGVVYMAEQEEPVRRRVALKVIRLGMDTKNVIARFEAERQALALMDHPNIARVLDAGATETGRPYFVMELVRGIKITDYCDQNNLPTQQRLELFIQVCRAIQHAHQKGIIHRDIKPSNILVTLHDGIPLPKVIDFGIAKATTDQRLTDKTLFTQFEQFIGTPAYMSPEQAEMGVLDIDTRSDIYSLGVLLYELLTGKTPFDSKGLLAAGLDEMRRTIREKPPVRPSTRLRTLLEGELTTTAKRRACEAPKLIYALRGDLDWIVMKALEKDRAHRYETANALALDVQHHLNHEAVTAQPPSRFYRLRKMARRNRLVFAAGSAVAATLIIGILATSSQWIRAEKESAEKDKKRREAEAAKTEADRNLYVSLLSEARLTRQARYPGFRKHVFELVHRARTVGGSGADLVELRCEASRCLGDFVGLDSTILRDFPASIELCCLDFKGRAAAFALENSTISLCELPTGHMVANLTSEPGIRSLSFSPDANQLLAVYQSGRVARWTKAIDGRWPEVGETFALPGVFDCPSSVKGQFLAIENTLAGRVELLDWRTRAIAHSVQIPQEIRTDQGLTVALSRDDRFLAIGGDSRSNGVMVQVWDFGSGTSRVLREPQLAALFGLNFSEQAEFLGCLSNVGGRIYASPEWRTVDEIRDQFDFDGPTRVAFAPDRTIAAWPVKLRDWIRKEDLAVLKEPRRAEQVAFIEEGKLLLTSGGRQARVYQLNTPEKLTLRDYGPINAIAFRGKNSNLAATGKNNTVRVWDFTAEKVIWTKALPGMGETVAYSPDGNLLAAGVDADKPVMVWDAQTGKELSQLETTPGYIWTVEFSPDGRYLVAAGELNGVNVWKLEPYKPGTAEAWPRPTFIKSFPGSCCGLAFSRDSQRVAFMNKKPDYYHEVDVWNFTGSTQPHIVATNLSSHYQAQAFTPDGRYLLNTDTHRAIVRLDLTTDKEVSRFTFEELSTEELVDSKRPRGWGGVATFCLSPDGTKIAVALISRAEIDIWDARTGRKLYSLSGPGGARMAWSLNGQYLSVTQANGDIPIWNLREIERALTDLGFGP